MSVFDKSVNEIKNTIKKAPVGVPVGKRKGPLYAVPDSKKPKAAPRPQVQANPQPRPKPQQQSANVKKSVPGTVEITPEEVSSRPIGKRARRPHKVEYDKTLFLVGVYMVFAVALFIYLHRG